MGRGDNSPVSWDGRVVPASHIKRGGIMKRKILNILKNTKDFISGEEISRDFNMTRASIWKYINSLREEGYNIESVPSKGYRLVESPDILTFEEIEEYLTTDFIGRNIYHYDSIKSTNIRAKEIALEEEEGTLVIGEEQLGGKGRMGRSWLSLKNKGIYMSMILKPDMDPGRLSQITLVAASSVYKALDNLYIKAQIKWPNDILIDGKKICGILTEISGELNRVNYLVLGIGINANLDRKHIPEDLKDKATSLKIHLGKEINRKELVANILNEFEKLYIDFKKGNTKEVLKICREKSSLLGKDIKIIKGSDIDYGKALDINDNGELVVEYKDGRLENLFYGEVSVRCSE